MATRQRSANRGSAFREESGSGCRSIDEANLQFRGQVQEWKNVLLRGRQAEAQTKYWSQFEAQERAVQDILGRLGSVAEGELKDRSRQDSVLQRFYSFLFPSYPLMTIPFIKPDLEVHIAAGPVRVFRTRSSPFAARRATTKRG